MLANIPLLLPNETLYSWCAETSAFCGGINPHELGRELFGRRSPGIRHDLPGGLGHLSACVGPAFANSVSPADMTLLRYYLTTLPEEVAAQISRQTLNGPAQHIKLSLGLPSSGMTTSHPLKACPVCVTRDDQTFGRSYWHLDHQYPGVALCRHHLAPLLVYPDDRALVTLRNWIRPEESVRDGWPESIPKGLPAEATAVLSNLAEVSARLPDLGFGALSSDVPPA